MPSGDTQPTHSASLPTLGLQPVQRDLALESAGHVGVNVRPHGMVVRPATRPVSITTGASRHWAVDAAGARSIDIHGRAALSAARMALTTQRCARLGSWVERFANAAASQWPT